MLVDVDGRGIGELLHQLAPGIFRAGVVVAMGVMAGGEGGRRDKTDVGGDHDEGQEAEDGSTLAGLSREEKIDESREDAGARSGGAEGGEMGAQGMGGHAALREMALGGGSAMHQRSVGYIKDSEEECVCVNDDRTSPKLVQLPAPD